MCRSEKTVYKEDVERKCMYCKYNDLSGIYEVKLIKDKYLNGNLAVIMQEKSGEIFAKVTVNTGDLWGDLACVDINNLENIEEFLKTNNIAQPTGSYINSGFCRYPIYIFNEKKLTKR